MDITGGEIMKNFMIGMYGKYDDRKFKRDFKKDFHGIEACLFKDERDIERLAYDSENIGYKFGIHFPLRAGISKLRDSQFLSLNENTKINSYKRIEEELKYIKQKKIKPEYILFHYPKPVILNDDFDMKNWRFSDSSEYTYESSYSWSEFKRNSEYLFNWLSDKGFDYNFIPVLEFDALNEYVCGDNFIEGLLEKYKNIKLCLDTGRLHLQSMIDPGFDAVAIIKRFAKYAEVVHLWNVKVNFNLESSHFPALPCLKTDEGWAPISDYMKIIREENRNVKIMFEHRSDLISDEELDNCYLWIESLLKQKESERI